MVPNDHHDDAALLEKIERRATRIWLRRRAGAVAVALTALAIAAVPVTALDGRDSQRIRVAGPPGGGGATSTIVTPAGDLEATPTSTSTPDTGAPPSKAPSPTATTITTVTAPEPACDSSGAATGVYREDGALEVEFSHSGTQFTPGCETAIRAVGAADPAEFVGVDVDWGDGTVDGDPQPAIVCAGASDERVEIDREFRHAYEQAGSYDATMTVTSYSCTSDGVVTDQMVFSVTFSTREAVRPGTATPPRPRPGPR